MRAVDQVIAAMSARKGSPVSWLVGEPCFPPPPPLIDALARASASSSSGYPPHNGLTELRVVLATNHRERGQEIESDQIVVTGGAKAGLLAVLSALLEPGDELIHPRPGYPAYGAMAGRLGAKAVPVAERGGGFEGWTAAVADRIGPRTRAVVLASPSNPTGTTLDASEARALVELCRDRGCGQNSFHP